MTMPRDAASLRTPAGFGAGPARAAVGGGGGGGPTPDDWVTVATCFDPTEAHLLQGALSAAGIEAAVGDGQTVQTDPLLAIAVRVRVRVRARDEAAARAVLQEREAGVLALPGEDAQPPEPAPEPQPAALFNPDAAALWSLLLTPVFGTALMAVNAWRDPAAVGRWSAAAWLVATVAVAVAGGPLVIAWWPVWYLFGAQPVSRALLARYGRGYRRSSIAGLAIALAAALLAAGWLVR